MSLSDDERSMQGRALLAYLNTLNISIQPLTSVPPCRFTKAEMRSILAEATAEARSGQGTSHEDFKREMATWL